MESVAHPLSKKSYGGTGFGSANHKSVYDDVFGGPPNFGVVSNNLAPRFEDYGEIFGGFHSSRGLSIPVLDLPSIDEAELSFNVRSNWFDYSEVFGGFHDFDFTVSFDDLVSGDYDYSSDDAWTPDRSRSFSDEMDSSNADYGYKAVDATKFRSSYYKANQRTRGEIVFGITKEAGLSDKSGDVSYIDKIHASQKRAELSLKTTGDCVSKIDRVWRYVERKQFTSSMPATIGSGSHETESSSLEKSNRSHAQSKPFVTIEDISLITKPSGIPPPSRPPPHFAVKRGISDAANSGLKDSSKYGFEQGEGSHSPPFYDVEVDVSSSKNASTTIKSSLETDVNNRMEIAESKRNCVKQSIEKKEIPYCHVEAGDDDNAKLVGQRIMETYFRANTSMDDITHATEGNRIHPPLKERNEQTRVAVELPRIFDGEECGDITKKPTESRDVGECKLPSHLPQKFEGTFAWRQDSEYIEVVETDSPPSEAVVHDNYGRIFVPDRSDKYMQASDLHNVEAYDLNGGTTDEIVINIHENKANGRRHWKSFETADSHKFINKDVEQIVKEKPEDKQEKRNKNQKQSHEKGENKKNPNKFCDGIDDVRIIEEAIWKDYIGDGLKEASSHEGIEDKLKRTVEEENARDGNVYSKIEVKNRQSKVVPNLATQEGWNENTIRFAFDKNCFEGSSRVTKATPESTARNEDAFDHEVLDGPTEHVKWDVDCRILNSDQAVFMKRSNLEVSVSVQEEMHDTLLPQGVDRGFTQESISHAEDENMETAFQTSDQKLEEKTSDFVGKKVSGKTQKNLTLEKLEAPTEDVIEAFCSNEPVTDSNQSSIDIGTSSTGHGMKISPMAHAPGNMKSDINEGQGNGVQFIVSQENSKNEPIAYQTSAQRTEDNKKTEVASSKMVGELSASQRFVSKNAEREEKRKKESFASEERKTELRLQKERELKSKQLRKLEEEREREREREKDRMAIDSTTFGNRGRSFADNLERSERRAVDRATAEVRQRAASAREISEPLKDPPQGAGTSSMLRYSYSSVNSGVEGESPHRCKSRLERYHRTAERAAEALAEKNKRDLLVQKELDERCRLAESLDIEIKRWSNGKEGNLRALLSTLQYILGSGSGWQAIPLTEVITAADVKKAYRKATLCVHPDKLQQRGASIQQKYICEKIFDLLQEAWRRFNSEER